MWPPKASREVEEKDLAGGAAADTAEPSAGQRAHLGPGLAKGGTKGRLSPPPLTSSRLGVARKAQTNIPASILPGPASPSAHHAATPRTGTQPQLCSGPGAAAPGSAGHGGQVWDSGMDQLGG